MLRVDQLNLDRNLFERFKRVLLRGNTTVQQATDGNTSYGAGAITAPQTQINGLTIFKADISKADGPDIIAE